MRFGRDSMTCRDFAEFVAAYLARELGEEEHARFEEHLAECPECVRYLASYEETIRLAKGVR
jgi:anti-sigma factor RsiW